jgi:putative two-component system response regulator
MNTNNAELDAANAQMFRVLGDLKKVVHQRDAAHDEMIERHFDSMYLLALGADIRQGREPTRLARVGATAEILAQAVGISREVCEMIRKAAPLHDIGMVAIPDDILLKDGELGTEEWLLWRGHTEIGSRILSRAVDTPLMRLASEIALTHHEAFNGRGYPGNLAGEAIPLSGRIVAVADYLQTHMPVALDGNGSSMRWAILETMPTMRGIRFDPGVVDLLPGSLGAIDEACELIRQEARTFEGLLATGKPSIHRNVADTWVKGQ